MVVHSGFAVWGVPGVVEVAVVVPLEVGDVVLVEQRVEALPDVLVRALVAQVEHVLVARRQPRPTAGAEDPLGVGAGDVGVEVDHLRLHPEAELHAEGAHVVDQRAEALRPDVRRHGPVAETAGVVAPAGEPAVVKHEAFDADGRTPLSEGLESLQVLPEVDGFPGVQDHRTGGLRVHGSGPQVAVEPAGDLVQAMAVVAVEPRTGVALAALEDDLAVVEELAAAEQPAAVVEPLAVHDLVAAPRQVDPPHLAAPEAETRPAGRQHMGRVEPGSAAPYLAGVHPDGEGAALRNPLHRVPAGEVHQLVGFGRHRQREPQRADRVRLVGDVGQGAL